MFHNQLLLTHVFAVMYVIYVTAPFSFYLLMSSQNYKIQSTWSDNRLLINIDSPPDLFRWEVIANYMNLHSTSGMKRTAKDVINKAKNLQRLGELTYELPSAQSYLLMLIQACRWMSVMLAEV